MYVSVFCCLVFWAFLGPKTEHEIVVDSRTKNPFLSVVIPAYNEKKRLPQMLDDMLDYLRKTKFSYEIIVVDDSSTDETTKTAGELLKNKSHAILRLTRNSGKGSAVRVGVLHSFGEVVLFCDADGATRFSDFDKLLEELKKTPVVFGSRAHLVEKATRRRTFFRNFLMQAFHVILKFVIKTEVRDTQCGFKAFDGPLARRIFQNIHIRGWAFDVELVYLMKNTRISEVDVEWQEIPGSKIEMPIFVGLQMFFDILRIGILYSLQIPPLLS